MTKSRDKSYLRSLQAYEWSADKMPSKKVRKFKRKERQKGKKDIRKALDEK